MSNKEVSSLGTNEDGEDVWLTEEDDATVLRVGDLDRHVGAVRMTPQRALQLAAHLTAWADKKGGVSTDVVADEREACARLCDFAACAPGMSRVRMIAEAIRARSTVAPSKSPTAPT